MAASPSVDDYVRAVAHYVPPALVSPESFAQVGSVARLLPAALTTDFGFECRLGTEAAHADLCLCLSVAGRGRDIAGGQHSGIPAPRVLADEPGWARAREFCRNWADPTSPLHGGADHVWLEFDLAEDPGAIPAPNLLFAPQFLGWTGRGADAQTDGARHALRTVELGIELLAGGPLPATTARALSDCFRALPAHACIFNVGVMSTRTPSPVRLSISHLVPSELVEFLLRVGWDGDADVLHSLVSDLRQLVDDVTFDVDVNGTVGPKVGLECYLRDRRWPQSAPRLEAFLDELTGRGLCIAAKRDALLAYPGFSSERTDPDRFPAVLARAGRLFGGRTTPALSRYLHHVKIVFQEGRAREAKAYLGVAQLWLDGTI